MKNYNISEYIKRKSYKFKKKICLTLDKKNFFQCNIEIYYLSKKYNIDNKQIVSVCLRNGVLHVITKTDLYRIQMYGINLFLEVMHASFIDVLIPEYVLSGHKISNMPLCVKTKYFSQLKEREANPEVLLDEFIKKSCIRKFKYEDYKLIVLGLRLIRNYKKGERAYKNIDKYLRKFQGINVRIGLVHGDFHKGNILIGKAERTMLIDFDCSRKKDIQAFDTLYYVIQNRVEEYNNSWIKEWVYIYKNVTLIENDELVQKYVDIDIHLALLTFFLERMAQEYFRYEDDCWDLEAVDRAIRIFLNMR